MFVGLDLGGSTIKVGVVTEDGTIATQEVVQIPSRVAEGPRVTVDALLEAFELALNRHGISASEVQGVGLCTPGPASADGVISRVGNLKHADWENFPIRKALSESMKRDVRYLNDGTAAAVGEFSVSNEWSSLALFALGTGLGSGIVVDGRPVIGYRGGAAECGHVALPAELLSIDADPTQFVCGCGKPFCAEAFVSIGGLHHLLRYFLTQEKFSSHELSSRDVTREVVFSLLERATLGDELALACFDVQAEALGFAIAQVVHVIDPEVFVISGGICETPATFRDPFLERVKNSFRARALTLFSGLRIEWAQLGDRAGAVGAASYARLSS